MFESMRSERAAALGAAGVADSVERVKAPGHADEVLAATKAL
jgi:hypothetical protein